MVRRTIIAACILLFLVLAALWAGFDWPPHRLILKYGFPPTGGPTGRTMTIEGVEFVELKPGYFRMGSHFFCQKGDLLGRICSLLLLPWGRKPRHVAGECPLRWVEISYPYWIARTEITNEQYNRFGSESHEQGGDRSDDSAAVMDAKKARSYCAWLSTIGNFTVQLPTEEEWENACRAGTTEEYGSEVSAESLDEYAWYANEGWYTTPRKVATRRPNRWGLYDMQGNALERCSCAPVAESIMVSGSVGPLDVLTDQVLRGGDTWSSSDECRPAARCSPYTMRAAGLRPVLHQR